MDYVMIVEIIPYRSFKEKINIVKAYDRKAVIEIHKNYIYVERIEKGAQHEKGD